MQVCDTWNFTRNAELTARVLILSISLTVFAPLSTPPSPLRPLNPALLSTPAANELKLEPDDEDDDEDDDVV